MGIGSCEDGSPEPSGYVANHVAGLAVFDVGLLRQTMDDIFMHLSLRHIVHERLFTG